MNANDPNMETKSITARSALQITFTLLKIPQNLPNIQITFSSFLFIRKWRPFSSENESKYLNTRTKSKKGLVVLEQNVKLEGEGFSNFLFSVFCLNCCASQATVAGGSVRRRRAMCLTQVPKNVNVLPSSFPIYLIYLIPYALNSYSSTPTTNLFIGPVIGELFYKI